MKDTLFWRNKENEENGQQRIGIRIDTTKLREEEQMIDPERWGRNQHYYPITYSSQPIEIGQLGCYQPSFIPINTNHLFDTHSCFLMVEGNEINIYSASNPNIRIKIHKNRISYIAPHPTHFDIYMMRAPRIERQGPKKWELDFRDTTAISTKIIQCKWTFAPETKERAIQQISNKLKSVVICKPISETEELVQLAKPNTPIDQSINMSQLDFTPIFEKEEPIADADEYEDVFALASARSSKSIKEPEPDSVEPELPIEQLPEPVEIPIKYSSALQRAKESLAKLKESFAKNKKRFSKMKSNITLLFRSTNTIAVAA